MSSVEPQTPYTEHVGNGVTTAFSYEFQLLAADDLVVTIDGVVIPSSDFVLTGVGNQAGGDVTFTVAPVNGAVVLLSRTILLKRDIDYQYNGALAEQTVDLDFNRLWQALQGAMAIVGGAVRAPFPEQIPALPNAAARANTLLAFDASGDPTVAVPASGSAADVLLQLASVASALLGPALVGFNPTLSYAPNTLGRTVADREWNPRDYPWLAKFDGVTDDTAAIMACANALYAAGGGTIRLPRGTALANIDFTYVSNFKTLNWRGAGKGATIVKAANAALPAFKVKGGHPTLPTVAFSEISDFTVDAGTKVASGFEAVLISDFTLRNLHVTGSSTSYNFRGSLLFSAYDCTFFSNTDGIKLRKEGAIRCNMVTFKGGAGRENTGWGIDLGDCTEVTVEGVDLEHCGTLGNAATGPMVIRSTVDDETGSSLITICGGHHEQNTGNGLVVEACAGLRLALEGGLRMDNNASGVDMTVGAIARLVTNNVIANGSVTIGGVTTWSEADCSWATLTVGANVTRVTSNSAATSGAKAFSAIVGALGKLEISATTGLVSVGAAGLDSAGDITTKGGNVMLKFHSTLTNVAGANALTITNAPLGTAPHWVQASDDAGKVYYFLCQRTA